MEDKIFFSVIIPTFNRAELIQKTIHSVLDQSYINYELIIVDDGSTDNTEEVVAKIIHPKIQYYKKENAERGAARNFGIEKASGAYITFLDSDDIYFPDYLLNAYHSLSQMNFPPFFHLAYEIRDENKRIVKKIDCLRSDNIYVLIKGNPLSCLGVFIHQEVLKKYRFNENRDLSGSEDWELWLRLAANFGLKSNNTVSAALIQHNSRSVLNFDEIKLLIRKNLALESAFKDEQVKKVFGPYFTKIESFCDSYISLHLVLSGHKFKAIKYFLFALKKYPFVIFERRSLAILKYLFK